MGRPRTASDEELLERIDTALAQRTSFEPWGLQDVAAAAGMSPGGLIRRFGSKEQLLHALTRRWIDSVPRSPQEEEPGVELRAYVEANFATASSAAAIFALGELMRDLWSSTAAELLHEGWRRQVTYLEALLGDIPLAPHVDPHVAALTLLDALHGGLYRQAVDLEPTSPTRILERLLKDWT